MTGRHADMRSARGDDDPTGEHAPPTGQRVGPPPLRPSFEFRRRPPAVAVRQPAVVTVSAHLWLAAGGLGIVAALVMLLDLGALKSAVRAVVDAGFPREQPATRDRVVALASAVLMGSGLLGLAQIGAALRLRTGRAAARYLLVVLLIGTGVETMLSGGVVGVVARLALVLAVVCGGIAAVFQYLPAANRWFAAQRP